MQGKGGPQQDVQSEREYYGHGGLEHKRVAGGTEGHQRVAACACQVEVEVEVGVPLGYPRPVHVGAVFYIQSEPC